MTGPQTELPVNPGTPPATLLVVDDEPGIVDSLQKVFEREHSTCAC